MARINESMDLYMCKSRILKKQKKLNFMKGGKALKIKKVGTSMDGSLL
jgi:hypothetical protein